MKAMSNSKHNTLKRLAELYKQANELLELIEINTAFSVHNEGYEANYARTINQSSAVCNFVDSVHECVDNGLITDDEILKCLDITRENDDIPSQEELVFMTSFLSLAIYKLAWGKESFDGLVDSLIKSDYDESK